MEGFGRALIWSGLGVAGLGILFVLIGKMPGLGRLPGDIVIKRENVTIFIPLGTMILVSVVLTLLLNLVRGGNARPVGHILEVRIQDADSHHRRRRVHRVQLGRGVHPGWPPGHDLR